MEYYPLWLRKDIQLIDHSLWEQKRDIRPEIKRIPLRLNITVDMNEYTHAAWYQTHTISVWSRLFFSFIETFFTRSIDSKHTQRLKDRKCSCTQCPSCFHLQSLPLLFLAGPCVLWPFVGQSSDVVCYINPRLPSDDIKAHPASIQL